MPRKSHFSRLARLMVLTSVTLFPLAGLPLMAHAAPPKTLEIKEIGWATDSIFSGDQYMVLENESSLPIDFATDNYTLQLNGATIATLNTGVIAANGGHYLISHYPTGDSHTNIKHTDLVVSSLALATTNAQYTLLAPDTSVVDTAGSNAAGAPFAGHDSEGDSNLVASMVRLRGAAGDDGTLPASWFSANVFGSNFITTFWTNGALGDPASTASTSYADALFLPPAHIAALGNSIVLGNTATVTGDMPVIPSGSTNLYLTPSEVHLLGYSKTASGTGFVQPGTINSVHKIFYSDFTPTNPDIYGLSVYFSDPQGDFSQAVTVPVFGSPSSSLVVTKGNTTFAPPTLDAYPFNISASTTTYTFTGKTVPGSTKVVVSGGGSQSHPNPEFSYKASLRNGENLIEFWDMDAYGDISASVIAAIAKGIDYTNPAADPGYVVPPTVTPAVTNTYASSIALSGHTVSATGVIVIEGSQVMLADFDNSNQSYSIDVPLVENAVNTMQVIAYNAVGASAPTLAHITNNIVSPIMDATKVSLVANPAGTDDYVVGLPGAAVVGGTAVQVYADAALTQFVGYAAVNSDGSFNQISIGDNAHPEVWVLELNNASFNNDPTTVLSLFNLFGNVGSSSSSSGGSGGGNDISNSLPSTPSPTPIPPSTVTGTSTPTPVATATPIPVKAPVTTPTRLAPTPPVITAADIALDPAPTTTLSPTPSPTEIGQVQGAETTNSSTSHAWIWWLLLLISGVGTGAYIYNRSRQL